jgi:hypothetical protein
MPLAEGVTIHCNDVAADASEKSVGGGVWARGAYSHKQWQKVIFGGV